MHVWILGVRCGHSGTTEFTLWDKGLDILGTEEPRHKWSNSGRCEVRTERKDQSAVRDSEGRQWEQKARAQAKAEATDTGKEKGDESCPSSLEKTNHDTG